MLVVRRPAFEREGLVRVLALAAREGLPLGGAARAYGELCSVGFGQRAQRLSALLERGQVLPEAVAAMPGILPHEADVLARLGRRGTMLAPALGQGVAARDAQQRDAVSLRALVEYPLVVLGGMTLVCLYVMNFVTPRLRAILRDHGFPMPELSQAVFSWLSPLTTWIPSSPEGLLMMLVALVIGGSIAGLLIWALNTHGLLPPGPRAWLRRKRECSAIVRGLSVGMEAGEALPETMAVLAQGPLTRWTRRRLLRAREAVEDGTSWPVALRKHGIVSAAEAGVLEAAERAGNVVWALREVADSRERRLAYRVKVLCALVQPLVIVGLGVIVMTIVVAYFLPIVDMIMRLSELD